MRPVKRSCPCIHILFPGSERYGLSFLPFTNYEWFVKDLNAVFYLVKNLDKAILLSFKGKRYTTNTDKQSFPQSKPTTDSIPGKKSLILETCWPPGSTAERLLFAILLNRKQHNIKHDLTYVLDKIL